MLQSIRLIRAFPHLKIEMWGTHFRAGFEKGALRFDFSRDVDEIL
jgi:hypothetical protein